jgi:hypothetical protein
LFAGAAVQWNESHPDMVHRGTVHRNMVHRSGVHGRKRVARGQESGKGMSSRPNLLAHLAV